eukprot:Gb_41141 [translate_table: standard]
MSATIPQKRPPVSDFHPNPKALVEEKRENRLYIGNLDHRITEYHVIKMFSPFGKICCEEFMWHTHGPKRGEPRGFAFIEYSKKEEAEKAKECMNGRLALGRPLVVRFVDEKLVTHSAETSRHTSESNHPNASLSSCTMNRSSKIAAIQNKLKSMGQEESSANESVMRKRARSVGMTSSIHSVQQYKETQNASKMSTKSSSVPARVI